MTWMALLLIAALLLLVMIVVLLLRARHAPPPASEEMPVPEQPTPLPAPPPAAAAPPPGLSVTETPHGPHPRPHELDREGRRELLLLHERLVAAFFERFPMSLEERARIADALLIVHDRMPVAIALEQFEAAADSQVSAPLATELTAREMVATLNEQLSPDRRLRLLGTLDEPLPADVYGPA